MHVLESERPEGSDGETLHETMLPPLFVAVTDVMAVPVTRFNEEGVNVMDGATSLTVKVMLNESEPAELLAQTVYVDAETIAVGVPQNVPLEVPKFNPAGRRPPSSSHVEISPPVLVGMTGEIAESLV